MQNKSILARALLFTCICSAFVASQSYSEQPRPNILLIMAEDMSSRVGVFGDEVAQTPNIDSLARKGTKYTNVYTTAGVCSPSRAAQILGVHQISTGAQHMRTRAFKASSYRSVPPSNIKAYPEILRANGYFTFVVNKLDYQFSDVSVRSGPFTIWDHESSKVAWGKRSENQPFFGFVTFYETHESKLFPRYVERIKTKMENYSKTNTEDIIVPPYYPDNEVIRNDIANHYNNISIMDGLVGDLLQQLQDDGLEENTIVIWTTDHGDGLPRGKRELYDSGIKVPLVVYWPEKFRNQSTIETTVDKLISFVDIGPSILSIAGIDIPEYMHGSPQLDGDKAVERDFVYASKDRLDEFEFRERAIRNKNYKYIKNYMPGRPGATHLAYRDQMLLMQNLWENYESGKLDVAQRQWFNNRPEHELYNIIEDPYETKNLAYLEEYKEQLIEMRSALDKRLGELEDMSDESEIRMAKRFWPGGKRPLTSPPSFSFGEHGEVILVPSSPNDSVGYQLNKDPWQLYHKPLLIGSGDKLRIKAVKYGWAESNVIEVP